MEIRKASSNTKNFFLYSDQTSVLALEDSSVVGCATICYIDIMPTYSHPTGRRAHIMNVYTKKEYRRKGIALSMLKLLIEDAKINKATEISLDATELGRPLYERLGFVASQDSMVLLI